MPVAQLVPAVAGFAIVVGYAVLIWRRRRGGSSYLDDSSILLAAPPPGMTPATAAIVNGAPTRLGFTTALLDLASRDEIAFRAEGATDGVANVGIAINGGTSADPRVLLNRRRPAGEGETWLLGRLKIAAEMPAGLAGEAQRGGPSPVALETGAAILGAMLRSNALTAADDAGEAAIQAREHGLLSSGPPDLSALAHAYEERTGHPLPPGGAEKLGGMAGLLPLLTDPTAIARDPAAYEQTVERMTGRALTPAERARFEQGVARFAAEHAARTATPPGPEYIPASQARSLSAPLFGTFVQAYARRHGWLGAMPVVTRLRWRLIGVGEVVAGVVLIAASPAGADLGTGVGIGILGGGIVTYLMAPLMVRPTAEGGRMAAQLAAYRRTLQLTFNSAASMGDVVRPTGLPWLETPDQALVWGMGLGLHAEIEALLARSGNGPGVASGAATPYVPTGFGSPTGTGAGDGPPADAAAAPSVVAMFAGIEAIGTGGGH